MGGFKDKKFDDETSSLASFEEVGAKDGKALPSSKDLVTRAGATSASEEVPDVLYVVQYRDVAGRIVDTRESDKPLTINTDSLGDETSAKKKKPVIEIVTRVSASLKNQRPPPPPPRHPDVYGYGGYYSDSEEEYGRYGNKNNQNSAVKVTKVETTEMVIHSSHLKAALNAVVGYYTGVDFIAERVAVEAPYRALVHHRKELELYKLNQPRSHDKEYAETTSKHIDILLSFLNLTFGEQIEAEENRWNANTPAATFDMLWMLLKPGEIMYTKEDNHWTAYVISRVVPAHRDNGKQGAYMVEYWNIEFSFSRLQRQMHSIYIHPFNGEQAIQSLSVIPARFFPGGEKVMAEKQVRLGKLYWELSKKPSYKEYSGKLMERDGNTPGNFTGRVIIDCQGYDTLRDSCPGSRPRPHPGHPPRRGQPPPNPIPPRDQLPQFKPRCSCAACNKSGFTEEAGKFTKFDDLDPNKDEAPESDLFYHVITDTIPAFILGDRRWGILELENLSEVKVDGDAFKYLVLDDEIKLTVRALIGKFASSDGQVSPWPSDFVKNKGEGRIFLLHGSPGVGKTCTAECVAELTHRPLLSLTSGDISTSMSPSSVERNLNYFMKLGERYGALLLLDEADVYLEERRTRDLHRNGLVSIFLRALEYYRGVLFLTTNRVDAFDSAFTSRIHVALHYKKLTDEDRSRIWTHNFERLERDSAGKCYVPLSAREFCYESEDVRALHWNGREIRNALQTAVALAETEAIEDGVETVTVTDKHLRAVVKMSRGFKDFLRRRRGWDDDLDEEESDGEDDNDSVEFED